MFSDTPGTPGPSARGAVERLDRLLVHQRVHLGDDSGGASRTRVLGLAGDLLQHHLVHTEG